MIPLFSPSQDNILPKSYVERIVSKCFYGQEFKLSLLKKYSM